MTTASGQGWQQLEENDDDNDEDDNDQSIIDNDCYRIALRHDDHWNLI
jgi:hypothetical protein